MKVVSLNISEKKGIIKTPIDKVYVNELGFENDAHAGDWHRQITLLAKEQVDFFSKEAGRKINFGEFAENITTEGIDLTKVAVLDRFKIGEVEMMVTQIGKECHGTSCAIYREVGNCIMPKLGIFCKVLKTGNIKIGDSIEFIPFQIQFEIITLSDRASKGEYSDRSGAKINEILINYFNAKAKTIRINNTLISDNAEKLKSILLDCKSNKVNVVITTGGTGIGPRDITPDVVKTLLDKEIPGIMEMIRFKYGQNKPKAMLSRSVCGLMGETLIYTLPGSVKAVEEYMAEILQTLEHLIFMKEGLDVH